MCGKVCGVPLEIKNLSKEKRGGRRAREYLHGIGPGEMGWDKFVSKSESVCVRFRLIPFPSILFS